MKQEIGDRIIRHVDVDPSVVVVVAEDDAQALALVCSDPGLSANIGERAITVISVEDVRKTAKHVGMTVDPLSRFAAVLIVVDRVEIHIVGHVEIHISIVIDVSEGAARAPEFGADAGVGGRVEEALSRIVPIQTVRSLARDIEIDPAVVVIVGRAGSHAKARWTEARPIRHIGECPVLVVSIEPVLRCGRDICIHEGTAVDEKDVLPPIVVVVEDQASATHRFGHVLVWRSAVFVVENDPGRLSSV